MSESKTRPLVGESFEAFVTRAEREVPGFDPVTWWKTGGAKLAPRVGLGWSAARAALAAKASEGPPTQAIAETNAAATSEPAAAAIAGGPAVSEAPVTEPTPSATVEEPITAPNPNPEPTPQTEILPATDESLDAFTKRLEGAGQAFKTWYQKTAPSVLALGGTVAETIRRWQADEAQADKPPADDAVSDAPEKEGTP